LPLLFGASGISAAQRVCWARQLDDPRFAVQYAFFGTA
jgi:hypothetical protein